MNGIYLYLLLREIRSRLIGAHVERITWRGRAVQIVLDKGAIVVSLYPTGMGVFLSDKILAGYDQLKGMDDVVRSFKIADILQTGFMPVMEVLLEKSYPSKEKAEIIISMYPEAPNFVAMTRNVKRQFLPRYIEKAPKGSVLDIADNTLTRSTVERLVKDYEGIDKKMARELNAANLNTLKEILQGKKKNPNLISAAPIRVSLFSIEDGVEYRSFNELFEAAVTGFLQAQERNESEHEKRLLVRKMKRRVARLMKRLRTAEEIEVIRIKGEMILANIAKIERGSDSVSVLNPYTQKQMTIDLDPKLSAQQNAQRYFTRYKKEKRGQPKLRQQIKVASEQIGALREKAYFAAPRKEKARGGAESREPFHKFQLQSKSVVYVGKNARSNDELTFKRARPGDYFFHTRGQEGAHVILKPNIPKGQRPSREDVTTAAAIAAYFSKARKQHNVPVSYCQRKYLKKNRKGKAGSVILMREEVIFVEPELPRKK